MNESKGRKRERMWSEIGSKQKSYGEENVTTLANTVCRWRKNDDVSYWTTLPLHRKKKIEDRRSNIVQFHLILFRNFWLPFRAPHENVVFGTYSMLKATHLSATNGLTKEMNYIKIWAKKESWSIHQIITLSFACLFSHSLTLTHTQTYQEWHILWHKLSTCFCYSLPKSK